MAGTAASFKPVSPLTQELRLATTMTGGVSLAVWMGGVAREMNLLAQASDQRYLETSVEQSDGSAAKSPVDRSRALYQRLLSLLDVVVDIDILSGTSAGGINAALLAFARVNNLDLGSLRELWLDLGAMLDLLRDPTDADLPSLMYGDRRMFADLANQLPELPKGPARRPDQTPETTLYITTTLLTGENSRFTDSYGTLVHDVDHHGLFTFDETTLTEKQTQALALAARSTASFPGAFEPAFLPFDKSVAEAGDVPERPPMRDYANITGNHWVADGGLLDNQPIDVLLERVFDRHAERPVRRVLLYVVPSAGPGIGSPAVPKDDVNSPPDLVGALLKDLGAVTSQSITRDLNRIREHNDRMTARVDSRLRLAELACRLPERVILDGALFADYCAREAARQAVPLAESLTRALAARKGSLPENWQQQLDVGGAADTICREAIENRLRTSWLALPAGGAAPDTPPAPRVPAALSDLSGLDRPAFDVATSVALTLVRAAYQAAGSDADRTTVAAALQAVHNARPRTRPDTDDLVGRLQPAAGEPLATAATRLADSWRTAAAVGIDAWRALAAAIAPLATTPQSQAPAVTEHTDARSSVARRAAAVQTLSTYREYLQLADEPAAVAVRLFALGAAQRAMLPAGADEEQPVELIEVSADTRSLLAPHRATAAKKLTGLQLHHFGAFYKRSWRANDWMWGRLDGAGWLVHLLLDPRRLQTVCDGADTGGKSRAAWLITELEKIAGAVPGSGGTPEIALDGASIGRHALETELGFLDDANAPVPVSVPLTALWVARAWQRNVLDDEIPELLDAIGIGKKDTDWSPAATTEWAADVKAKQIVGDARLSRCPVPDEKLPKEFGSQLMVRTIAKAAATGAGALTSVKQVPAAGKPVLTTLRTVTLGGYRAVTATGGRARWMVGAGAILLVIGILLAISQGSIAGLTGVGIAAVGVYVIAFGAWQMGGHLFAALISATIVAGLAALATPWVRQHLFGTAKKPGWFGKNIHWIGDTWWRPWAVLAAILLAGALVAVVIPRAVRKLLDGLRKRNAAQESKARAEERRTSAVQREQPNVVEPHTAGSSGSSAGR